MEIIEGEDVESWNKVHAKTTPSFLGPANNQHWMRYFQLATMSCRNGGRRKTYYFPLYTKIATE